MAEQKISLALSLSSANHEPGRLHFVIFLLSLSLSLLARFCNISKQWPLEIDSSAYENEFKVQHQMDHTAAKNRILGKK